MIKTKDKTIKEHYFEAVGRRKTAVARIRLFAKKSSKDADIVINGKSLTDYFPLKKMQNIVSSPFVTASLKYPTTVKVEGGGIHAQAEAIRLGLSRALVQSEVSLRPRLKALGYLTRDPRMVERKKAGLRKARRPQQWRKR